MHLTLRHPVRPIEIDGQLVAEALGLELETFRTLMEHEKIGVLCERGTGSDAGRYRATFYHQDRRARFLYDGAWLRE